MLRMGAQPVASTAPRIPMPRGKMNTQSSTTLDLSLIHILPLFLSIGVGGMVLLTCLAPFYCQWVTGVPYALIPMVALAPAIPLACATSVYRGYYEGLGNMVPTAVSQVMEAAVKLGLGLAAAWGMVSHCQGEYAARGTVLGLTPSGEEGAMFLTLSLGAAGAVVGVTAGSLVSLGYLALRFRFHGDGTVPRLYRDSPPARDRRETRKRLWAITLPIALGSLATSVAGLIDATFLQSRVGDVLREAPQRLLAAYPGQIPDTYRENPQAIPTFLYGCYTLAMTIYLSVSYTHLDVYKRQGAHQRGPEQDPRLV